MQWFRHWRKRRKGKLILAPPEQIIHSLAVFRRAFLIIRAYGGTQDRAGQLFGGWLANTLHNVPSSLCYHRTKGWVDSRPTVFPRYVRRYAPEPIAANCAWIFSSENDPAELGLQADMSGLDLAPPEKLRQYLSIFYYACLTMRLMQNHGTGRAFWQDVETKWSARADDYGAYCAVLADVLHDVPTALVHWSRFDEREFWRQARRAERGVSGRLRDAPRATLRPRNLL